MRRTKYIGAAVALAMLLPFLARAAAKEPELPPSAQAVLLLRLLAYDKKATEATNPKVVVILVTHDPSQPGTSAAAHEAAAAFRKAANGTTIASAPIRIIEAPSTELQELAKVLVENQPRAAYLAGAISDAALARLVGVLHAGKILTLSGTEAHVRGGAAVGLVVRGSRAKFLINLPAVRASGSHIEPSVLRLAEIIQ